MLTLRLPYPPSVNTYWRMFQNRIIVSKAGRQYRNAVNDAVRQPESLSGRLSVKIHATMPDRRKRDLDNVLKACLDAMQNAGVYLDDSQIDELTVTRGSVEKPGNLLVTIQEFA